MNQAGVSRPGDVARVDRLGELKEIGRLKMERLGIVRPAVPPPMPPADPVSPTAERRRHGAVKRATKQLPDAAGGIGRPYYSIDVVAAMARRGAITEAMLLAADAFRHDFRRAQLDPLKSFDVGRLRGTGRPSVADSAEAARRRVWRKIQSVGGLASPAGSCLWHVVGWESSLKSWALEQGWAGRRVSQEAASGILIAALGTLAG